ncbi:MAG: Trigger factor [Parcubacteria group bacterium GW2011_GWC1_45_9]|nr:MAG: Trigger factor [Parcubacteria group bacterium GW2011_GWC1_45_9]HCI05544.1 trigger factor [Patescibacteria group bacterium]
MEHSFKKLSSSKIELQVSLPEKDFEPYLEKALLHLAGHLELPGFRKGKAPLNLVRQKLGEFALYEEAAETAIKDVYLKIAEENNWEPIGRPEVAVEKLAPKNPFEFKILFEIMPEVKLSGKYKAELKKLKKEKKEIAVSDKEIEESLNYLRRSRSVFSETSDPANKDNWLTIDLELSHQNQLVEGGVQNDFRFSLKDSTLLPGFAEKLINAKPGDKLRFSLAVPKDYWKKEIAGKDINFDVLVKKIESEKIPEADDEFAKTVGKFNNLAELKENLNQSIAKENESRAKESFRLALMKKLSELTEIELPEILVEKEKHNMLHELRSSIESNHLDWQDYLSQIQKTESQILSEFSEKAAERLKYALIFEEIARQESIEPTEEEVKLEADKFLAQFKNIKEAEQSIDAYQLVAYTKSILRNEKVSQFLEQTALSE